MSTKGSDIFNGRRKPRPKGRMSSILNQYQSQFHLIFQAPPATPQPSPNGAFHYESSRKLPGSPGFLPAGFLSPREAPEMTENTPKRAPRHGLRLDGGEKEAQPRRPPASRSASPARASPPPESHMGPASLRSSVTKTRENDENGPASLPTKRKRCRRVLSRAIYGGSHRNRADWSRSDP